MELNSFALFVVAMTLGVHGTLRFPHSYSNHMVLQRAPQRAILWGYADVIGDTVIILKNGVQVEKTTVQANTNNNTQGFWKVKLPPESNAGPFEIQVMSSEGTVSLYDVMFGDVWICSGQSNMEFSMIQVNNSKREIDDSIQYRNVRMIFSAKVKSSVPEDDVQITHPWILPDKESIGMFSALCFLFARDLQKHLNYPIGVIESNWPGTAIEVWSTPSASNACPPTVPHTSANDVIATSNRRYGWPTNNGDLWNSMIHPYISMTIKGIIWYQGENNRMHPHLYACQFPAMINDWRKQFHAASGGETSEQFPFGFVQLAPRKIRNGDSGFAPTRWAQTGIGYAPNANMPNTFMAIAIDLPDFNSPYGAIHPRYKQDIAARLVLGARNVAYGEHHVTFQGPFPSSYNMDVGGNSLIIVFDNGTSSLQVNTNNGFEICCASTTSGCSKRASWEAAAIKGNTTSTIKIEGCPGKFRVVGVRYLWKDSPCALKQCALYCSKTHLPVPPFIETEAFGNMNGVVVG